MILGFNHITLSVPSLEEARNFYCTLLGLEEVATMSWEAGSKTSRVAHQIMGVEGTAAHAAHFRAANLILEVFQFTAGNARRQDPEQPLVDHGITHLCLAVTSLDEEYQRLVSGRSMGAIPLAMLLNLKKPPAGLSLMCPHWKP